MRSCARCGACSSSRRRLLQWSPSSEVERTLGDWLGCRAAHDVDRAGRSRPRPRCCWSRMRPDALCGRRAGAAAVGAVAGARCGGSGGRARVARAALSDGADWRSCAGWRAAPGRSSRPTSAAADHWLPPDNVQEQPALVRRAPHVADQHRPVAARRPRRLRLRLPRRSASCSTRTAHTLAHAGIAASAIAATSTTGTTRRRCSRCAPRYVSTVDSGNLAGHLLTLRQGLLALRRRAGAVAVRVPRPGRHVRAAWSRPRLRAMRDDAIAAFARQLDAACRRPPRTLADAARTLDGLQPLAAQIARTQAARPGESVELGAGAAAAVRGGAARNC